MNIKKLKVRLENLPQVKDESDLVEVFGYYIQKLTQSYEKLEQALKDMRNITKVFPSSECKKEVLFLLKNSVTVAKKLHTEIEEDPEKVKTKATDNKVVKLSDYASSARTKCDNIWAQEIESSVTKWEKIASVVQNLGAKGGRDFKQAVDNLKRNTIPKNDSEVDQANTAREALQEGIADLGLEGPFGRFLKATAEGGASPRDLLDDEIRRKMDEHKLWDSFRVLLDQ